MRIPRRYVSLALATVLLSVSGNALATTAPAAPDAAHQELTRRVADALARTRGLKVVYQDVLGEGPGSWDPDPRYPAREVNCITWLQLLLAETYGSTPDEKHAILDRIRYFDGRIGFGFRKHFTDQWTAIDPMPLRQVDFRSCPSGNVQSYKLELDTEMFQKNIKFECPLYHMDRAAVELDLVPPHGLVQCGDRLAEGYYVIFPVASDRYLQKYGGFSGPMAQVHAVLLEVPPAAPAGAPLEARDPGRFKVYHASISRGQVVETELAPYLLHMWNLYRGYVVYELVPGWDWRATPAMNDEAKAVAECESKLKGRVGKLFENEIEASQP